VAIDVVICTYNRAADLDRTLACLAAQQRTDGLRWTVLVVDNASTDDTSSVIDAWKKQDRLPHFRSVLERTQGLSHARARGFRETTADWTAFVDDDNLLADDWLEAVGKAIEKRPDAGGFGGRVILDWVTPPPSYLRSIGWCFAEQDHGDATVEIDNLVGAGMVLSRKALLDAGWPDRVILQDRVGTKLISGGDVEMVQRVKLAGHRLWYVPGCVLRHRIAPARMTRKHVLTLAHGLGSGAAQVSALCCTDLTDGWSRAAARTRRVHARYAFDLLRRSLLGRDSLSVALVQAAFAAGFARGVRAIKRLPPRQREQLIGAAAAATLSRPRQRV
jgi:glycosyltransferase involved in cell wall biosynthesis